MKQSRGRTLEELLEELPSETREELEALGYTPTRVRVYLTGGKLREPVGWALSWTREMV